MKKYLFAIFLFIIPSIALAQIRNDINLRFTPENIRNNNERFRIPPDVLRDRLIVRLPDLIISRFITTGQPSILPNGFIQFPVRVTIRNQGNAAANIFKIGALADNRFASFTISGQSNYAYTNNPLPAGGEITFSGNISIHPQTVRERSSFSISIVADSCSGEEFVRSYCHVQESNERNNTASLTVQRPR